MNKDELERLVEETSGGYSYDAYVNWKACCAMLLRLGYTFEEAKVIMLSKYTRWAGDYSSKSYGKYTSNDLKVYVLAEKESIRIMLNEIE